MTINWDEYPILATCVKVWSVKEGSQRDLRGRINGDRGSLA